MHFAHHRSGQQLAVQHESERHPLLRRKVDGRAPGLGLARQNGGQGQETGSCKGKKIFHGGEEYVDSADRYRFASPNSRRRAKGYTPLSTATPFLLIQRKSPSRVGWGLCSDNLCLSNYCFTCQSASP